MKFETTQAFDADFRRLKAEHRAAFRDVVRSKFVPVCGAFTSHPVTVWPKSPRVKSVHGAPGVLEMTWSLSSPDGRATFEIVAVDGELRCRWRRVGDHDVFNSP